MIMVFYELCYSFLFSLSIGIDIITAQSSLQVTVSKHVIDSGSGRPELEFLEVRNWIACHFSRVWVFPLLSDGHVHCVWGILERVVHRIKLSGFNHCDLLANANHRVDKSIQFFLRFTLGWFHHECSGHRPGHGWGVVSVIDQPLGNIFGFDVHCP